MYVLCIDMGAQVTSLPDKIALKSLDNAYIQFDHFTVPSHASAPALWRAFRVGGVVHSSKVIQQGSNS